MIDIKHVKEMFEEADREQVENYNNDVSWYGFSTERNMKFISDRVLRACEFLVILANHVSAQQNMHRTGSTARKIRYSSAHFGGKHARR